MFNVRTFFVPFLIVLAWPQSAEAQPKGPEQATPTWPGYDQAVAEMAQKNYAAACPRLEEVVRSAPNDAVPMITLGECNEGWGRLATAYGLYRRAEQAATARGDQDALKKAQAKIADVEPRSARLTLEVPPNLAATPGVTLMFDRQPLDRQLWGAPLFVDKGEHSVEVWLPGRDPWTRKVAVEADGETYLVKVNMKVPPPATNQPYNSPYAPYPPYPPQGAWWPQAPKPVPEEPPVQNAQHAKRFSVRVTGGAAFFMTAFPSLFDTGGFTEVDALYRLRLKPKVRLDLGLEGRYYGNVDASHWKVGFPFEFVFEFGRYIEMPVAVVPGATFIVFDSPHFAGSSAFDIRIQTGLQFILNPTFTLGFSPISFDIVMPTELNNNMITYEPRAWVGAAF